MSIIIVVPTFGTKIETHDAKLNSNHYKKIYLYRHFKTAAIGLESVDIDSIGLSWPF